MPWFFDFLESHNADTKVKQIVAFLFKLRQSGTYFINVF